LGETQDEPGDRRLAASAFSDQSDERRLVSRQGERDVVHGLDFPSAKDTSARGKDFAEII
jgi:hypothetical protein